MCVVEDENHDWRAVSCTQRLPFFCYDRVAKKSRSVLKIQFQSDLDMSDPRIYRTLLEKIQERFSQSGDSVAWKTPPTKKKPKKSNANPTCALRITWTGFCLEF
ncbi:hypothetical protein WMY93_033785 [Mugilogobius chulae]|uniref:Uncharacterized protein n=1 Tax=Mugilogobius chulae TaxID=88201 RepID=A0AAW0MK16_9GOBI